jgi:CheY-like chemotaxis protein/class 3 adenylate cyclase
MIGPRQCDTGGARQGQNMAEQDKAGTGGNADLSVEGAASPAIGEEARRRRTWLIGLRQDLLAPIVAILDYTEMLLEDSTDEAPAGARADLEKVRDAGRQLQGMVDTFFETSAIESGKLDVDRLGNSIRHDLRTPLNHIIGYSEMLIEDAEDEGETQRAGDLCEIRDSGNTLLGMFDEILSGDTPVALGIESATDSGDLSHLVEGAVNSLEDLAEEEARDGRNEITGKVLVVDDNEINRDVLARRLGRQGHEVENAADGKQALAILKGGDFDAVLLDILMPEMNGFEVLDRMKEDPALKHIPVIMISGLDQIDPAVRCIKMGAEDYLPKPFNPTLLKARLGACLEKKQLRDREVMHQKQIEEEKQRADDLLHVILPDSIVEELKETNAVLPRRFENVAVLFTDIVSFTPYCEGRDPEEIIATLQTLVEGHEELMGVHEMQKIKTIGDSYMAAAGLLKPVDNPVLNSVRCGLEMLRQAAELPAKWQLRIGIHAGPVVAGVLGRAQYLYDLFGDTVNTAARMESNGIPGSITLSGSSWKQIDHLCEGESLGFVDVKGKGKLEIVRFVRFRDPTSETGS